MTNKPATEREMILALNERMNQFETRWGVPAVVDTPQEEQDYAARFEALETHMKNAINELEARAERAIAAMALLTRKDA